MGMPFICDAFDEALHTVVFKQLVEYFNSPSTNKYNAQLIFTAHDTYALDCNYLRRDEVHIVDKDKNSISSIERLSEKKHVRAFPNMELDFRTKIYGSSPTRFPNLYDKDGGE